MRYLYHKIFHTQSFHTYIIEYVDTGHELEGVTVKCSCGVEW